MSVLAPHVRRWSPRLLAALVAACCTLLVLPGSAQAYLRSQFSGVAADTRIWSPSDAEPLQPFPSTGSYMQLDQRDMYFGQQAVVEFSVAPAGTQRITADTKVCGTLVLEVTRYQAYSLYWRTGSGASAGATRNFLYRGGLVADYGRPFVGVFFAANKQLVIRTYNRVPDRTDDRGQLIRGAVYNSWTAASSATVPGSSLLLRNNGLWSRTSDTARSPFLVGASGSC